MPLEDPSPHDDRPARYAAGPGVPVRPFQGDEAVRAADTLSVPNQLGVDGDAQVLESVLTHAAPETGRR